MVLELIVPRLAQDLLGVLQSKLLYFGFIDGVKAYNQVRHARALKSQETHPPAAPLLYISDNPGIEQDSLDLVVVLYERRGVCSGEILEET